MYIRTIQHGDFEISLVLGTYQKHQGSPESSRQVNTNLRARSVHGRDQDASNSLAISVFLRTRSEELTSISDRRHDQVERKTEGRVPTLCRRGSLTFLLASKSERI